MAHGKEFSAPLLTFTMQRKRKKPVNLTSANAWNNSVSFGMISDNAWFIPAADCGGLCRGIKCHFSLMCHASSVLLWHDSDSRVIERELNIDTDIVTGERWVHSSSIDSSAVAFPLEAIDTVAGISSITTKNKKTSAITDEIPLRSLERSTGMCQIKCRRRLSIQSSTLILF